MSRLRDRTTLFGSGITVDGDSIVILTPSHQLEGIYQARSGSAVVASNSLVGVLAAAGLELDSVTDYSSLFGAGNSLWQLLEEQSPSGEWRLPGSSFELPTRTQPVTFLRYENLAIAPDLTLSELRKPREEAFTSFADFKRRLTDATASLIANAAGYDPLVSLSAGYDSTAVAAMAAACGCHEAVGFLTSRPAHRDGSVDDSGAATAAILGMDFEAFDRLAYTEAHDKPEAEFLATGQSGEEIIFSGLAGKLRRRTLLNGYWAGRQWAMAHRDDWRHVWPSTSAGASITEFRLRSDFYFVPLPCFGAVGRADAPSLLDLDEMDRYRVGGHYDRPIPRRLAEEAGVPRGTFGVTKHAANVVLPVEGISAFTAESRQALNAFAAAEGSAGEPRPRRRVGRADRAALRVANRLGARAVADRIRRRQKAMVHFDAAFGNLVLRWAIDELAPRYAAVARTRP